MYIVCRCVGNERNYEGKCKRERERERERVSETPNKVPPTLNLENILSLTKTNSFGSG